MPSQTEAKSTKGKAMVLFNRIYHINGGIKGKQPFLHTRK